MTVGNLISKLEKIDKSRNVVLQHEDRILGTQHDELNVVDDSGTAAIALVHDPFLCSELLDNKELIETELQHKNEIIESIIYDFFLLTSKEDVSTEKKEEQYRYFLCLVDNLICRISDEALKEKSNIQEMSMRFIYALNNHVLDIDKYSRIREQRRGD